MLPFVSASGKTHLIVHILAMPKSRDQIAEITIPLVVARQYSFDGSTIFHVRRTWPYDWLCIEEDYGYIFGDYPAIRKQKRYSHSS